jgi:methionyl-tRNA formyltransferase
MNVLVLCDNDLLKPAEKIFRETGHKICFTQSVDINPILDAVHITKTYDIVFSLHCKLIFPKKLHERVRCINVHPGFNPYNRGMYPHIFSIVNGLPTGATIHEITEHIDNGPIIIRKQVGVRDTDTGESLYHRIIQCEFELLNDWVGLIIDNKYRATVTDGGNYNSKEDFKRLCNIDLTKSGRDLYDTMRALYHSEYNNAHINDTFLKLQIL